MYATGIYHMIRLLNITTGSQLKIGATWTSPFSQGLSISSLFLASGLALNVLHLKKWTETASQLTAYDKLKKAVWMNKP